MTKTHKTAASVIDVNQNAAFAEALAIQSSLTALSAEIKNVRGHRDDAEFRQYMLTALAAAEMGVKPNSKGSTAIREAFISAGRSKRNSETIVQACLNRRVAALAKQALSSPYTGDAVDSLRALFLEIEIDSVTALKRWLAPATNIVDDLCKKIAKLDGDEADMFEAAMVAWIAERDAKRDAGDAGDMADAA